MTGTGQAEMARRGRYGEEGKDRCGEKWNGQSRQGVWRVAARWGLWRHGRHGVGAAVGTVLD